MCVIAYKPLNIAFPSNDILKNCFDNNPDGAGFMYAMNNNVYIQKGYTTYESFKTALDNARAKTGDNVPYVMHFRIATQGYEKTMTHPFPLSSKMKKLKKTRSVCNIGVAHNGIISLTSDGAKDYSDTMKFITDYLSLIIRGFAWYKDEGTKTLIERLIDGSRLAILDKYGHCELLGKTWTEDKGIFYSNTSYSYSKVKTWDNDWGCWDFGYYGNKPKHSNVMTYNSWLNQWEKYFDHKEGLYHFKGTNCPAMADGDYDYCEMCAKENHCAFIGTDTLDDEFESKGYIDTTLTKIPDSFDEDYYNEGFGA